MQETVGTAESAGLSPEEQRSGEEDVPGVRDSALLAMDSILTLLLLFRSEAALAISTIPALVKLNVVSVPIHLLTWLSFCVCLAVAVFTVLENALLGVVTFFLLQLGLSAFLESRIRILSKRMGFRESRKGLVLMQDSLKERFRNE